MGLRRQELGDALVLDLEVKAHAALLIGDPDISHHELRRLKGLCLEGNLHGVRVEAVGFPNLHG